MFHLPAARYFFWLRSQLVDPDAHRGQLHRGDLVVDGRRDDMDVFDSAFSA